MVVNQIITSNMWYLLPAFYAFISGLFYESSIFIGTVICSPIYHACFDLGNCATGSRDVLQFMDFLFAYLQIAVIAIYYLDIYPRKFKAILHCGITMILAFITHSYRWEVKYYIFSIAVFIPLAIIHFIIYNIKYIHDQVELLVDDKPFTQVKLCNWFYYNKDLFARRMRKLCCTCFIPLCSSRMFKNRVVQFVFSTRTAPFHPLNMIYFVIGLMLFVAGYLCQIYSQSDYEFYHSMWHRLTALAGFFLLIPYGKPNMLYDLYSKARECR